MSLGMDVRRLAFFAAVVMAVLSPLSYALLENAAPWPIRVALSWLLLLASILVMVFAVGRR